MYHYHNDSTLYKHMVIQPHPPLSLNEYNAYIITNTNICAGLTWLPRFTCRTLNK